MMRNIFAIMMLLALGCGDSTSVEPEGDCVTAPKEGAWVASYHNTGGSSWNQEECPAFATGQWILAANLENQLRCNRGCECGASVLTDRICYSHMYSECWDFFRSGTKVFCFAVSTDEALMRFDCEVESYGPGKSLQSRCQYHMVTSLVEEPPQALQQVKTVSEVFQRP